MVLSNIFLPSALHNENHEKKKKKSPLHFHRKESVGCSNANCASSNAPDANSKAANRTEFLCQFKLWLTFRDDKLMPTFYSCGAHLLCLAQRPPVNSAFRHVYAYPPVIMLLHANIPELYGIMDDLTLE